MRFFSGFSKANCAGGVCSPPPPLFVEVKNTQQCHVPGSECVVKKEKLKRVLPNIFPKTICAGGGGGARGPSKNWSSLSTFIYASSIITTAVTRRGRVVHAAVCLKK